jgi:hypothetical protein
VSPAHQDRAFPGQRRGQRRPWRRLPRRGGATPAGKRRRMPPRLARERPHLAPRAGDDADGPRPCRQRRRQVGDGRRRARSGAGAAEGTVDGAEGREQFPDGGPAKGSAPFAGSGDGDVPDPPCSRSSSRSSAPSSSQKASSTRSSKNAESGPTPRRAGGIRRLHRLDACNGGHAGMTRPTEGGASAPRRSAYAELRTDPANPVGVHVFPAQHLAVPGRNTSNMRTLSRQKHGESGERAASTSQPGNAQPRAGGTDP